ncbi:MAG TPA: RNA polymerase sigma factor [Trebonia sp.]
MARAGHDYATADTTTAEHATTAATKTESAPAGRAEARPNTDRPKSPRAPGRRAKKPTGSKATAKLKSAGRKTAAKLRAAPAPGTRQAKEAATDVAASANDAVVLDEETDELTAAVQGAQRGDSECFRVLYREVQPKLLRYLSFLVDNDAEDIASETWLQATRDLHKFQGNIDNFRGWITTIARHRAMDHLRKHSRQPPAVPMPVEEFSFFAAADDTEARAIESITTDDAVKMISSLPRDQAEAVLLRAVVGMDAKTAAAVVGKRAGAIRTAAYRGLKTLAKRLGAEND